jgi:hypothetical protein
MNSWSLDDYLNARNVLNIAEDKVAECYYYWGGSIRYFRKVSDEESLQELIGFLENTVTKVSDFTNILQGSQGEASFTAVNSLMQRFNDSVSVVSQFVVRLLLNRVGLEFVKSAQQIMQDNPAWQGWVFELEFMVKCYKESEIRVYNTSNAKILFPGNGQALYSFHT